MTTTSLLFQNDSYLKQFEAKVIAVRPDGGLILDQTCFYYNSGGQPSDKGKLVRISDGVGVEIKDVRKIAGEVAHFPSGATPNPASKNPAAQAAQSSPHASSPSVVFPSKFSAGDVVSGEIDWPRRYQLMRMHTAGHCLGSILFNNGALITGNQLDVDQSRFDFSLEEFNREQLDSFVMKANAELAKDLPVRVYSLPREEAMKLPGFVKLANALPPNLPVLRIVEIVGLDVQADGGTHVKSTKEAGQIELVRVENKGAKNRRIYFVLKP